LFGRIRRGGQLPIGPSQAGRAAEEREYDALGQQYAARSQATRSHRCPYRDLPSTRGRAGHQQIRNIGAGDQQNEADANQEHDQGATRIDISFSFSGSNAV